MKNYKGHVKITLRDAKTNKIDKIIEGDNIVTDAVKEILENNVLGSVDYTQIYPLWSKWFSGCLAFENSFPEVDGHPDASKIFIPDDSVNHVVAHAGDIAPQDQSDDLKRGSPNTHTQVITNTSVKQVWEWGPQAGCGTISAVALTHKDIGNLGTGANSNAFKSLNPFEVVSTGLDDFIVRFNEEENVIGRYDGYHGWWFNIGEPGDYTRNHTAFRTNKITLYLKRIGFDELGLYETTHANNEFNIHKTVTLNDYIYCQPAYYIDGTTLHLFTNITGFDGNSLTWNNTIKHWKIEWPSPEVDPTVTYSSISTGRSDIAPLTLDYKCNEGEASRCVYVNIPHASSNGTTYWFFPCSDNASCNIINMYHKVKGLLRISSGGAKKYIPYNDIQQYWRCSMHGDEITPIVMPGRVCNGDHVYTCQDQFQINDPWYVTAYPFSTNAKTTSYVMPIGSGTLNNYQYSRFIAINKFLTTTRFNLPAAVTKTASQSMTIEYTITEV